MATVRFPIRLWLFCLTVCLMMAAGCGTLPNGRGWGQDATLFPGWRKIGSAALGAALSPGTWAPAAGALVLQIDDWDKKVTNWASSKTPIFGSQENARTASDVLESLSVGAYGVTAVATPSGDEPGEWTLAKLKGACVGVSAIYLTYGTTIFLQRNTDRRRPDNANDLSFPSAHSSRASVSNTLAARNINFISMPDKARLACKVGFALLTASTAWARLESNVHYPSDVLAGIALGHFIGAFMNDAFIGADPKDFALALEPSRKGAVLAMYWAF